jgi:hypothetical protein
LWSSLRRDLRGWRALDPARRRDAIAAALLLGLLPPALRLAGFGTTRTLLARLGARRPVPPTPDALARAQAHRALVEAVGRRLPWQPRCLPRALALQALLTRAGVPADLRLGVRKRGPHLDAHAWVECGGVPLEPAAAWTPLAGGAGRAGSSAPPARKARGGPARRGAHR